MSRAGPPMSLSRRSHWRPSGAPSSANATDSPASTTIGTRSCNAMRSAIAACKVPTVV
jgi:hypothetical protein